VKDETTRRFLVEAKHWCFDVVSKPARIVPVANNYAIEVLRDTIEPGELGLWLHWNLELDLAITPSNTIRVHLKMKPLSKAKAKPTKTMSTIEEAIRA
jgi:hypothetical protein